MPKYEFEVTNPAKLAGLDAARQAYNDSLPKDADGNTPGAIQTNQDYVQFVMDKACESYAKQYGKG